MNYIIITVPHATCTTDLYRMCDTRASEAAQLMEKILKSLGRNVILLPNYETIRSDYDMNRRESRQTHYRLYLEKIISDILNQGDDISLVLDMHSFPSEYSWSNYRAYKMVFLYLTKYHEEKYFQSYFEHDNNIGILEGSHENDIMITSNEKNIKSILIEVLENTNELTNNELSSYLYNIAKIIDNDF